MDRIQISTGVGLIVTIFKYAPIPLVIGSLVVLFVVPNKTVDAVP